MFQMWKRVCTIRRENCFRTPSCLWRHCLEHSHIMRSPNTVLRFRFSVDICNRRICTCIFKAVHHLVVYDHLGSKATPLDPRGAELDSVLHKTSKPSTETMIGVRLSPRSYYAFPILRHSSPGWWWVPLYNVRPCIRVDTVV